VDLDSVASELYGLLPGEFTAARNDWIKRARAAGERDLAREIQQLGRPTTAAWLVNRLARDHDSGLTALIDLGRELREATSNLSGDDLRALTRQRHEVVHALVQHVRQQATREGHRVSEDVAMEVRQTLEASLADRRVADAVLAGRLTRAASYAGFGEPVAPPEPAPRQSEAEVTDLTDRRREAAERELADAQSQLDTAHAEQAAAEQEVERTTRDLDSAQGTVQRLRTELADAERSAAAAGDADRSARERLSAAEEAVADADRARVESAARLDGLRG